MNIPRLKPFLMLSGNARVCIAFHPFWAIPYSVYMFYLGLYLKERGISESQLGTLMMAGSIAALVASFSAAPIVDRLGRRVTTLVFDLLSSAVPPLLFLFVGSYPLALVAMVLANLNRIMGIAFYLTMIEDSTDQVKITAMNLFNLILVAAGFMIAPAGILIGRMGLVSAQRLYLLLASLSMTFLAVTRHFFLRETTVGFAAREHCLAASAERAANRTASRIGIRNAAPLSSMTPEGDCAANPEQDSGWTAHLRVYSTSMKFLKEHPAAMRAMRTNVLFYVYFTVGSSASLYFTLYFTGHLGLTSAQASIIGGLYAAGNLVAMVFINPFFSKNRSARFISIASGINIFGFVLLVLSPKHSMTWASAGTLFTALGFGMLKTSADATFALETHGAERSGLYALSYLLSAVLAAMTLWLCSRLFAVNPVWLFILTTILVAFIFIDQGRAYGKSRIA